MSLSRRGLGGKYVGFGSSPGPAPRSNYQGGGGDVFSVMSEVKLSLKLLIVIRSD